MDRGKEFLIRIGGPPSRDLFKSDDSYDFSFSKPFPSHNLPFHNYKPPSTTVLSENFLPQNENRSSNDGPSKSITITL